MFFILGTGRSGTKTIADLISRSPDAICEHEAKPALIREAVEFAYGERSLDSIVELLRATRSETHDGKQYGEANHKLSLVIPALRTAFPDAKFIWLIRDGRDMVESAYSRGWYQSVHTPINRQDWDTWRIRADKLGLMSSSQWYGMSTFEKCCWYWTYRNRVIEQELADRDSSYLFVTLEDIANRVNEIFNFLNISRPDDLAVPVLNQGEHKSHFLAWNEIQKTAFMDYCADAMNAWYPEWQTTPEPWIVQPLSASQNTKIAFTRMLRCVFNTDRLPFLSSVGRSAWLDKIAQIIPRSWRRSILEFVARLN